jgi:hemin uptake protein HemP
MATDTERALQEAQEQKAAAELRVETLAKKLAEEKGSEMVVIAHNGKIYRMTLAGAELFAKEVAALRAQTEGTAATTATPGNKAKKPGLKAWASRNFLPQKR